MRRHYYKSNDGTGYISCKLPLTDSNYTEISEKEFNNAKQPISTLIENTEEDRLRSRRHIECFSIINRGELWYETLTVVQKQELKAWYQAWLDVTETKQIPQKPTWLR